MLLCLFDAGTVLLSALTSMFRNHDGAKIEIYVWVNLTHKAEPLTLLCSQIYTMHRLLKFKFLALSLVGHVDASASLSHFCGSGDQTQSLAPDSAFH